MRKILPLLAVLVLISVLAIAQTRTITGQVKDEKGEPLPFASVTIKGKNKGTTTDANGNFRIEAAAQDVLVFSAVGSKVREIAVGSSNSYSITLDKEGDLQEVVVTALGVQKQPRSLGYSVATVKNSELTEARVTNLQNGLVGKVSGLNVSTVNNGVFADTRIVLRGIRSLTGNNTPLLVLDGAPVELRYINTINPNDVESVNILKGANASALYGPDGVNGVIVVTTKKGGNRKPEIYIGNTTLFESLQFMPDLQTRFGSGSSYNAFGDGIYDPIENQSWGAEFNGQDTIVGREDEDGNFQRIPYAYIPGEKKRFFNTGVTVQSDISLRAGDDRSSYYLSLQDVTTSGVVPKDKARRTSLRLNTSRKFGKFSVDAALGYTLTTSNVTTGSIYWYVVNSPGQIPLTKYSDYENNKWAHHNYYFNDYYQNPWEEIDRLRSNSRGDNLTGTFTFSGKVLPWLTLTERFSITVRNDSYKNTTGAIFYSPHAKAHIYQARNDKLASVADGSFFGTRVNNEFIANAEKKFGEFNVKVLAGTYYRQNTSKGVDISGSNLSIPSLFNVSAYTGIPGVSESNAKSRLVSALGSINIGFKDFVNLEFTGRNDWDSRLPFNNNSYFYPGVNMAIVLSDAIPALQEWKLLSYAKLKAAWNKTGNVNVGVYQLESTFDRAGGFPYGSLASYTASGAILSPNLKPESVESYEFGGEFSFLDNRVSIDAAYYYQKNNDQVIDVAISQSTGFSSAKLNAAKFTNKGFEVDLKLTPLLRLGQFSWNFSGNFSLNDSKVTEVYQGLDQLAIGNTANIIKGYPAYVHKLTDWLRDPLGRVIIDSASGYPKQNTTPTIFGRTLPKYIVGLSTDLNYKGFTLKIVAEYRGGHYIYNSVGADYGFTGIDRLSAINGRQRFVFPNSVYESGGKFIENKNIVVTNAHYDFLQSSAFRGTQTNYYSSAAFWKIREVVLSYDLPKKWLSATKVIKGASVALIGRNLLMFRPATNWWTDPEFSTTTGNAVGTTSISQTPPTRLLGFNINVTF